MAEYVPESQEEQAETDIGSGSDFGGLVDGDVVPGSDEVHDTLSELVVDVPESDQDYGNEDGPVGKNTCRGEQRPDMTTLREFLPEDFHDFFGHDGVADIPIRSDTLQYRANVFAAQFGAMRALNVLLEKAGMLPEGDLKSCIAKATKYRLLSAKDNNALLLLKAEGKAVTKQEAS